MEDYTFRDQKKKKCVNGKYYFFFCPEKNVLL